MFLFDRSFGAAVAGLAVALLFVCFDRACEVPAADAGGTPVASVTALAAVAPLASAATGAAPCLTASGVRVAAAQPAVSTSPACRAPGAWGNLRAGS